MREIVKRILTVLVVALVVAAMLVVTAAPAFAQPPKKIAGGAKFHPKHEPCTHADDKKKCPGPH